MRGHNARKTSIRRRELLAWSALSLERRVLEALVYGMVLILIAFCTYINLLYGVLFTPGQSRAWILASLTAFLTDALVNNPAVLFGKTVFAFVQAILATSFDSVIMGKIVADTVRGTLPATKDSAAILARVLQQQQQAQLK